MNYEKYSHFRDDDWTSDHNAAVWNVYYPDVSTVKIVCSILYILCRMSVFQFDPRTQCFGPEALIFTIKVNLPLSMYCSLFDKYWGILWRCAIFSILFSLSWMPQQTLKFLPILLLQNCLFVGLTVSDLKINFAFLLCLFFFLLTQHFCPVPNHLPLLKISL